MVCTMRVIKCVVALLLLLVGNKLASSADVQPPPAPELGPLAAAAATVAAPVQAVVGVAGALVVAAAANVQGVIRNSLCYLFLSYACSWEDDYLQLFYFYCWALAIQRAYTQLCVWARYRKTRGRLEGRHDIVQ